MKRKSNLNENREVDVETDDLIIEIKNQVRAIRTVNESLIQLAYKLAQKPEKRGALLLINTGITVERIEKEWKRFSNIFREDLIDRLSIYLFNDYIIRGIPADPSREDHQQLMNSIERENDTKEHFTLLRSPDRFYDVLRFLIYQWMYSAGPLSPTWVAEEIGCSYPTVSDAIGRLGNYIKRHSDRKIELRAFPRNEWQRLVVNACDVRQTKSFAYPEGVHRSVESLLNRISNYKIKDVAVGGTVGARIHFTDVDIIGTPRLDLTVLCSGNTLDLSFLHRLDPGLKPAKRNQKATVVIHPVFRKKPLFKFSIDELTFTDPVECLLDLHEMHFEQQVEEIIRSLPFSTNQNLSKNL